MFDISYYQLIFFVLSLIIGFLLSIWVFSAGKGEKVNNLFSSMVILWLLGEITPFFIFKNIQLSKNIISFLPKLEIAFVFFFLIFFYFFSLYFLKENRKFKILNKIVPAFALAGALFALFTNLFQKDVTFTPDGRGLDLILSSEGKIAWLGFVIAMILFISSRFIINYFRSDKENKLRIQYILIGVFLWVITSLVFVVYFPLFRNTFKYADFGNYSILFLFAFTAYAIAKQHLFGIRVVLTQFLVGIIAILLFAQILDSETLFEYVWKGGLFITFIIFGYLLIRSVVREIKLREQLQDANTKLTKLDQAKSDFISIASHQLRTPLSAIKGYLSMVVDGDYGIVAEKVGQVLTRVYNSNERLIALVNNMLNISRIESGRIQFHPQPLQLELVINDVIGEIGPEARARQVQLIFRPLIRQSRKVQADDKIIHEVLNNLVDNAVKYTPHGTVTISLHPQRQWLEVRVKDTGVGISPDDMPRLFKKFSRGQDVYKDYAIGSGLGLYVVKQMVEMHGGTVGVESAGTGKGSTFWFTVPWA